MIFFLNEYRDATKTQWISFRPTVELGQLGRQGLLHFNLNLPCFAHSSMMVLGQLGPSQLNAVCDQLGL